jgi:sugar phosphate isomerase/epimerase
MKRRTFLQASCATLAGIMARPHWAMGDASVDERISLATLTFRARFPQTRIPNHPPVETLELLDFPEFIADTFHIHNVEAWSMHFESTEQSYLEEIRKRLEAANSRLINIQVQDGHQLAGDDEDARQASLARCKGWFDAAATVGAMSARIDLGQGTVEQAIRSFRELNDYAKEKGVMMLIENHGGLTDDLDNIIAIHNALDSENFDVVIDFGNFVGDTYEGIEKLIPYTTHTVAAKTQVFDEDWNHTPFDFGRCVRMCEEHGFRGIYSGMYWNPATETYDYNRIAQWMVDNIRENIS